MELDDLKQRLNTRMATHEQRSADDIAVLIKNDTTSLLQKLRKSLVIEMIIAVVFALLCVFVVMLTTERQYIILFGILSMISVAFIAVLYILLRKIDTTISVAPVKENLQKLIRIIDEYVRRYLQFTLILLPVCFCFGVWLTYNDPDNALKPLEWNTIALLGATMLVLGAVIYIFTKWYLRTLYGRHLRELKALLQELNEE